MSSSDYPFDSTPASRGGAYTPEESVMVNEALRTHRATTQAAERALKVRLWSICFAHARDDNDNDDDDEASFFSLENLDPGLTPNSPLPLSFSFAFETLQPQRQTAEKTKEVALATLDDLHEQGEQLGRVQRDLNVVRLDFFLFCLPDLEKLLFSLTVPLLLLFSLQRRPTTTTPKTATTTNQIDADVEESRSIVKYMRRCCLFFLCSCCCECDADAERDAMRKARVRARRAAKQKEAEALARIEERKRAAAMESAGTEEGGKGGKKKGGAREEAAAAGSQRQLPRRDPRLDDPSTEDAARAQLFAAGGGGGGVSSSSYDAPERRGAAYQLGGALADADREAVARETDAQEDALDKIGGALADLRQMGLGMQEELRRQDPRIDGVADHAQRARDDILHVSRSAQRGFGVKPVRQPEGPTTAGASTAVAKAAGKAAAKAAGKSLGL